MLLQMLHINCCILQVFQDCTDCQGSTRLMCWPHVYRNLIPRLRHMKSLDANLAKNVLADIEDLQWSALNQKVFLHSYNLMEEKYLLDDKFDHKDALEDFFAYFKKVWIDSEENNWFEGANPFASSNNQGIEGKNKEIKAAHTFRKRMPLGSFIDCMLRIVHEWSLEDSSLLILKEVKLFTPSLIV